MAAKKKKRPGFQVKVGDVEELVEVPRPAMSRTVPFGTMPEEGDGELDIRIGDVQGLTEVEPPPMGRTAPFGTMPRAGSRPDMRVSEADVGSLDMPMERTVPSGSMPAEGSGTGGAADPSYEPPLRVEVSEARAIDGFPHAGNAYLAALPGNIDLTRRPMVMNADGSHSTVRSMSFQDRDGMEVLIPTVSDAGKVMTNEEAIAEYDRTGKHLGKFWDVPSANAAAEAIHYDQELNEPANTLDAPMSRTVPYGSRPRAKGRR